MRKIINFPISSLLTVLLLISAFSFRQKSHLTQEQAIKQAESFIIANGYTVLPADKSKISYELFDNNFKSLDALLQHRHNSLHQKAFCISDAMDRWHVGFLDSSVDLNKLSSDQREGDLPGRSVIVMKTSDEIRMAHKEPLFSHFRKLGK